MPDKITLTGYCWKVERAEDIHEIFLSFDRDTANGSSLARLIESELGYSDRMNWAVGRFGKLRITVERIEE